MTDFIATDNPSEIEVLSNNLTFDLSTDHSFDKQADCTQNKDYFISDNGTRFAGFHLIIDLWGATNLDDLDLMDLTLRAAIEKAKATLLHIHLHHFSPNGGISGVAVLAESHISVHTWPEYGFAAFDVFMCGEAKPHLTIDVLREAFKPSEVKVNELKRGKKEEAVA